MIIAFILGLFNPGNWLSLARDLILMAVVVLGLCWALGLGLDDLTGAVSHYLVVGKGYVFG